MMMMMMSEGRREESGCSCSCAGCPEKTRTPLWMWGKNWLDESVVHPSVPGYFLVVRRDRDGLGGGVCVLAADNVAPACSLFFRSPSAGRVSFLRHTESGPF